MSLINLRTGEYIKKKEILDSAPKIMNIETTNFCNLRCGMCVAKNTRPQGFLSPDLLEKIIDDNSDVLKGQNIWLHYNGEPLLHPKLPEIIQLLGKSGVKTRLSTNAMLLNEKIAQALLDAGLGYIVFSIDAVSPKTYSQLRVGGRYGTVEKNVMNFLDLKEKTEHPIKTQVQMIAMEQNKAEVGRFISKWKNTSVNHINIKSFCTRAGQVPDPEKFLSAGRWKPKIISRPPCYYIWETLVILWNGDVIACCQDLLGQLVVGNVTKQKIQDIWNGPIMRQLRHRQVNNDFSMQPCDKCPDWKGFGHSRIGYGLREIRNRTYRRFFHRELKDEGISIIINRP